MTDQPPVARPQNPVEALVLNYRQRFEGALVDKGVKFDPFLAAVLTDCVRQPKLAKAATENPGSLLECLMVCANAGLLPGSAHQLFYLIPRDMSVKVKGEWTKRLTCTFIIDYRGLMTMAQRHPRVHSVEAFLVYEGEPFDFDPGNGTVLHKWRGDVSRKDENIVAAWAKATLMTPNGMHVADKPIAWAMTMDELLAVRNSSDAFIYAEGKKKDSAWHTAFPMMARKTVLRSLLSHGSVPRQYEMAPTLAAEREVEERFIRAEIADAPPNALAEPQTLTEELNIKLGGKAGAEAEPLRDEDGREISSEWGEVDPNA